MLTANAFVLINDYHNYHILVVKVNSVQEACAKCFAIHMKKRRQNAKSIDEKLKTKDLMFFV